MKRWLASTSNRTFVFWPLVLFAAESLLQQGVPQIHLWALPLLAWGYLQYRWVGTFRTREGGGGPGVAIPPDRIVRWVDEHTWMAVERRTDGAPCPCAGEHCLRHRVVCVVPLAPDLSGWIAENLLAAS